MTDFEYFRPDSVGEAVQLLHQYSGDAKVLAGGQTLIPMLNMRLARPQVVVDIGGISGLRGITPDRDGITIGAATRHSDIERSPLLAERCPLLPATASYVGHAHIRNRGTIGGSLAHADPAAEYPVALLALDGAITLTSLEGTRTVPAMEFLLGPMLTVVGPDELVTAVRVPYIDPATGWAFKELTWRSGDFAVVCVAVLLTIEDGRVISSRVAVGGAGPVPTRLPGTEASLLGQRPGADLWAAAGRMASEEIEAVSDNLASEEYRRSVTAVYVEEALAAAAEIRG